jgi:hypothetical protein
METRPTGSDVTTASSCQAVVAGDERQNCSPHQTLLIKSENFSEEKNGSEETAAWWSSQEAAGAAAGSAKERRSAAQETGSQPESPRENGAGRFGGEKAKNDGRPNED